MGILREMEMHLADRKQLIEDTTLPNSIIGLA